MSSLTISTTVTELLSPECDELDCLAADLGRSSRALGHEVVGSRGKRRQILGRVAHDVIRHCAAVKLFDEACRNLGAAPGERGAGLLDDGASCAFSRDCQEAAMEPRALSIGAGSCPKTGRQVSA